MFKKITISFSPQKDLYKAIFKLLGFYPHNISLYQLAFTHKSQSLNMCNGTKICNERLEYLGDAVLGAVIANYLFKRFPYEDEGFLTEIRSRIVCRNNLNKLAENLDLHKFILADKDSNNKAKFLKANAFEALIGAIFLDKGYDFTQKIIVDKIIRNYINIDELIENDTNYKSKLIEYAQKEKKSIEFRVSKTIGSGFGKQYVVNVTINGKIIGKGQDTSIKGAEQNAAKEALSIIGINE